MISMTERQESCFITTIRQRQKNVCVSVSIDFNCLPQRESSFSGEVGRSSSAEGRELLSWKHVFLINMNRPVIHSSPGVNKVRNIVSLARTGCLATEPKALN